MLRTKSKIIVAGGLLTLVLVQGCTYRDWYGGLKASERARCQQLPSPEYAECMQQLEIDYDEYKLERDQLNTEE